MEGQIGEKKIENKRRGGTDRGEKDRRDKEATAEFIKLLKLL